MQLVHGTSEVFLMARFYDEERDLSSQTLFFQRIHFSTPGMHKDKKCLLQFRGQPG